MLGIRINSPHDLFISRVDIIHWEMFYFSVFCLSRNRQERLFLRYELGIVIRRTQTTRSQYREHSIIDFPRSISPVNLSFVSTFFFPLLSFTAIVSLEILKTIGLSSWRALKMISGHCNTMLFNRSLICDLVAWYKFNSKRYRNEHI